PSNLLPQFLRRHDAEADLQRHLEGVDLTILDGAANLLDLEPVEAAQGFGGTMYGVADRLRDVLFRHTDQLDPLVRALRHGPLLSAGCARAHRPHGMQAPSCIAARIQSPLARGTRPRRAHSVTSMEGPAMHQQLDAQRTQAFAGKMVSVYTGGILMFLTDI